MNLRLIGLLVWRGLLPATDGGNRLQFFHRIFYYYLPGLGIVLFLTLVAGANLWLAAQENSINQSFNESQRSPFMAIFAEAPGAFFTKDLVLDPTTEGTDYDEKVWEQMTLGDIMPYGEVTAMGLEREPLFRTINPFALPYMELRDARGQHVRMRGFALPFTQEEGEVNEDLVSRIKSGVVGGTWREGGENEGIIMAEAAVRALGFEKVDDYPTHLAVKKPGRKDDTWLPLTVVDELPYYDYLLPMSEWSRIRAGVYNRPLDQVKIFLLKDYDAKALRELKKLLPPRSVIGTVGSVGGKPVARVDLPDGVSAAQIIERLHPHRDKWQLFSDFRVERAPYNGGIFYLNPKIIKPELLATGVLNDLRRRFEQRGAFEIRGDLIRTLSLAWEKLHQLKGLISFFDRLSILFVAILVIIVSLSMHMRMHRIGVIRMMGAGFLCFIIAFLLEGVAYIGISCGATWALSVYVFNLFTVSPEMIQYSSKILMKIAIFYTLGVILPSLYYFRLRPAEMLAYRNN